jgi:hypothetical protein
MDDDFLHPATRHEMTKPLSFMALLLAIAASIAIAQPAPGKATGNGAQPALLAVTNRLHLLPTGSIQLNGYIQDRIRLQTEVWFHEKTLAEMADTTSHLRHRPTGHLTH